jgi:quercetin dioxygenase-like cupin family protein
MPIPSALPSCRLSVPIGDPPPGGLADGSVYMEYEMNIRSIGAASLGLLAASAAVAAVGTASSHGAHGAGAKVSLVYEHELPNLPGKSIKGVLVEYGPGGSSAAHTHPNSAFIYATVIEGAVRSQVNDGPEQVFRAGQNFSENPGDRHGVSANASKTAPAKLLAVFVVDTADKTLVLPYR